MKNTPEIIYKTIPLFEPTTWLGLTTGWKRSYAATQWEKEAYFFNKTIVQVSRENRKLSKLIPWQTMADCMAESHRNQSQAIMMFRGMASAQVVDMIMTFSKYLTIKKPTKGDL
jgi:hypothetical protein